MTGKELLQRKILKLAWANLDWENKGEKVDDTAFLPLPEIDTLSTEEGEALEWVVARDKRKFANMPMLRDTYEFRVAPLFGALLQSPKLARFWAEIGDFFITAEQRGTLSEGDRAWLDMGVSPLLANAWTQAGNFAVAAANGVSADDMTAIRENRLDSLAPEARQIVDLAQATLRGTVTAEQFNELAGKKGKKWVVEAIGYAVYRSGSAQMVSAMWQIQGIESSDEIIEEMIGAIRDGSLGEQKMMDKAAYASERG